MGCPPCEQARALVNNGNDLIFGPFQIRRAAREFSYTGEPFHKPIFWLEAFGGCAAVEPASSANRRKR